MFVSIRVMLFRVCFCTEFESLSAAKMSYSENCDYMTYFWKYWGNLTETWYVKAYPLSISMSPTRPNGSADSIILIFKWC